MWSQVLSISTNDNKTWQHSVCLKVLGIVKPAMFLTKTLKLSTQYTQCGRQLAGQEWGSAHSCYPVFQSWCHLHHVHLTAPRRDARRVHFLTCQESGRWQPSATLSVPHTPSEPGQSRQRTRGVPCQCLCPFGCHQAKWAPWNRLSVLISLFYKYFSWNFVRGCRRSIYAVSTGAGQTYCIGHLIGCAKI